jgi:precorrin-6B methylase 2
MKDPFARDPIDELAGGYRAAQVLLTANRLGLFSLLSAGKRTAQEIASSLSTDLRATRILCDALVALSLLERKAKHYSNSSLAREYLLTESPQSKVAFLRHAAKLYMRWGSLYDTVKSGKPASDDNLDPRLVGGNRQFAEAMADTAKSVATQTAKRLNLSGVARLLDVGGGPGIYSIEFAREYPRLEAVILDNAETLEVAKANIERASLEDRVTLRAGDAFQDDWGGSYDFIFLSNVVHIYSTEANRKLVNRCAQALRPRGRLCIKDFFLDANRTGPGWASLFAVNMLLSTEEGDCYTLEEAASWIESAGLSFSEVLELTAQTRMVLACKAASR